MANDKYTDKHKKDNKIANDKDTDDTRMRITWLLIIARINTGRRIKWRTTRLISSNRRKYRGSNSLQ